MELPLLPALFDEFGKGADDRVHDYVRARVAAAIAEEREANAALVEARAGMRGTGAWVALTSAADAIRSRSAPRTQEG